MNNNTFVAGFVVSICYFVARFMELRILKKENAVPLKDLVKDALIVYFSVVVGAFLIEQLTPMIVNSSGASDAVMNPPAFTNSADF